MKNNYQNIFEDFSREIAKPAGDSDEYSSFEKIKKNHEPFISEVHGTWKKWHNIAIKEILTFDSMEKADRAQPIGGSSGRSFRDWTTYMRQIWRRANDAIVWSIFGCHRHVMKRLCLLRRRGPLVEANPESAIETINLINSDPLSIGIWNDATSCVDIGDVTFSNKRINQYGFIELKEGKVNHDIIKLNEAKDESEYLKRYEEIIKKYGKSGRKQIERIERQEKRSKQIVELLDKEKGIDPLSSQFIEIYELKSPDVVYDDELNELLNQLDGKDGEGFLLIDGCLWIYANKKSNISLDKVFLKFKDLLISKEPRLQSYLNKKLPRWDNDRIVNLNEGFGTPLSRPLFLRNIEAKHLSHIVHGDLQFRIYLYLDWKYFGELLRRKGFKFTWSTHRQALREKAKPWNLRTSVIVNGKLPQIRINDLFLNISESSLIRILFDGIKPHSFADQILESSHIIMRKK